MYARADVNARPPMLSARSWAVAVRFGSQFRKIRPLRTTRGPALTVVAVVETCTWNDRAYEPSEFRMTRSTIHCGSRKGARPGYWGCVDVAGGRGAHRSPPRSGGRLSQRDQGTDGLRGRTDGDRERGGEQDTDASIEGRHDVSSLGIEGGGSWKALSGWRESRLSRCRNGWMWRVLVPHPRLPTMDHRQTRSDQRICVGASRRSPPRAPRPGRTSAVDFHGGR
jgi:hypothetical protein